MSSPSREANDPHSKNAASMARRLTIPNLICGFRLVGAIGLVAVILADAPRVFLAIFLVLALTDYVDGRLAVWLKQQTSFGARLDSVADSTLYAVLLFAAIWMKGEVLRAEWVWIATAVGGYLLSTTAGLIKFGKLPSYHTRLAKLCNLLMLAAVVALFSDWSVWPLRIATAAVTLANLETLAITIVLRRWRVNVPSLWGALREPTATDQA